MNIRDKKGRFIPKGIHLRCVRCYDIYPVVCEKCGRGYCGHCFTRCPYCFPKTKMRKNCEHNTPVKGLSILYKETEECKFSFKNQRLIRKI